MSQSTRNALKRIDMQKKKKNVYPFDPLRSAKPELRSAMKFSYNQSDRSSNIFTKLDQNPTLSKRDISRKISTDTQTDTHTDIVCSLQSTDCDDESYLYILSDEADI